MENFTNETIDTATLPRFEEVQLSPLHPAYRKIIIANIIIFFTILAIALAVGFYFIDEMKDWGVLLLVAYAVVLLLSAWMSFISFRNRGFAFRQHDVIYRSGIIGITTTIIPYNRVQHAAVHEGFISRKLGLAAVEIFTAGGSGSDIKIPGIKKEEAENIKQLLMGKIQKEVSNGE